MTQAQHFKTKIQFLLIALVLLGLIATTFVGAIGWWASQNLSMTIDALGKNSLALSEGNMAISNTIANYLDRQERIIATSKLDELNQNEDKAILKTNFQHQYQTLLKSLEGLDIDDAIALNTVFIQFDQYDNQLFRLRKALLQSQQAIEQHVIEVNSRNFPASGGCSPMIVKKPHAYQMHWWIKTAQRKTPKA